MGVTATLEAPGDAAGTVPAEAPTEPPRPARPIPAALTEWRDPRPRLSWLVTLFVAAIASASRFWALGFPSSKSFDEVYYANNAQEMLRYGYEDNRGYMFIVHPPLGKWLIALPLYFWHSPAHLESFGWRIGPAIAGIASVVVLTRLVLRMTHSTLLAGIAGLLLALDGLSLVLSRTALLDVFLQTFVLAGFAALVVDRDRMRRRLGQLVASGADISAGVPTLGPRPWRLTAGVMFGAACAVKWTGLSFFVLFVLLSLWWDRGALRAAGVRKPWRSTARRSLLPAFGSLGLVPIATYLLTYLGWFTGENGWNRHWADTHSASARLNLLGLRLPFNWAWVPAPIRSLGSYTLQAYRFHEGLSSPHEYQSNPWSWLVLGRPVDFYYDGSSTACGRGSCSRQILLLGTPLMWWAFVPALLWLAWHWATTRDWRAGAVWVAFAAGWLVWFQDLKRTMFLFYMAPLVPFLIIAVTLALGVMVGPALPSLDRRSVAEPAVDEADLQPYARRRVWGLAGVAVYMGVVVTDFVWMWPIWTGGLLTYDQWHARMWFSAWI